MMQYPYFPQIPQQIQPQIQQPQQMQNCLVSAHSEQEALTYPVAPGTSIVFKVENQPLIITKTMGFSQFESPVIERYRLMKEESPEPEPQIRYALADDIDRINEELDRIKAMLSKRPTKKREESDE